MELDLATRYGGVFVRNLSAQGAARHTLVSSLRTSRRKGSKQEQNQTQSA